MKTSQILLGIFLLASTMLVSGCGAMKMVEPDLSTRTEVTNSGAVIQTPTISFILGTQRWAFSSTPVVARKVNADGSEDVVQLQSVHEEYENGVIALRTTDMISSCTKTQLGTTAEAGGGNANTTAEQRLGSASRDGGCDN